MENNNFLISVVIPTTNTRPEFIIEAINSIKNQTYQPSEVIIINNGKDDFKISDSNLLIKCYKIVNKAGVAQARNFGASLAKSQYVAFLDDDDLWGSTYLENMKNRIERDNPDCLIGKLDQLVSNQIIPKKNADGKLKKDIILIRNPGITGSSTVIKKSVLLKIGGYNPKLPPSEDKSLILELIKKNFKIVTVPESTNSVVKKIISTINRKHENIRLTNSITMQEGISQFYHIYKNEMNFHQKIINLLKINRHKWKYSKSFVCGLKFILFFIFLQLEKNYKKIFR